MRSLGWALLPYDGVLKGGRADTDTSGEGHVITEAEDAATSQEHQDGQKDAPLQVSEGGWLC